MIRDGELKGGNKKKSSKVKKIIIGIGVGIGLVGIVSLVSIFVYFRMYDTIYENCIVEIGAVVEVSDFEKEGYGEASLVAGSEIDTSTLGTYQLEIKRNFFTHVCQLIVQDTTPPTVEGVSLIIDEKDELKIEDCITNVSDMTEVTYMFETVIDMDEVDEQEIVIVVEDEVGNVTKVTSKVLVMHDTTPPVIEAPDTFRSVLGEGISYKQQISATDDSGEVDLQIDNSQVDSDTVGEYTIFCTATDEAGNVATKEVIVEIYRTYTMEEELNMAMNSILNKIINENMTDYEKAEAIFNWCHDTISYKDHASKTDWMQGAYDGLVGYEGDCFTYASTAKLLLTEVGIANMDIAKIPTSTNHYWNLVNLGDGWYHFDATRRHDGTIIFMWDDATLMEFSNANYLTHNYDKSLYPEIN